MTTTAAAIKRLDDLFQNIRLENQTKNGRKKSKEGTAERVHFNPIVITKDCDIHGKLNSTSIINNHNYGRRNLIGPRRESMPAGLNSIPSRRRDSVILGSPNRDTLCLQPGYASTWRRDSTISSTNSLKRDVNSKKDTFSTLNNVKKDSFSSVSGNTKKEFNGSLKRDFVNDKSVRKESSLLSRRYSTDSLDSIRRNSWETNNRRESSESSAGFDDPIWEESNTDEVMFGVPFSFSY